MTEPFRSVSGDPTPAKGRVGVVVIGRNEGARLIRCFGSIPAGPPTIYVDSGSDDGSPDHARDRGLTVVALDPAAPFTAARARNAGLDRLHGIAPDLRYVQMIDGDSELQAGWLDAAVAAMDADPETGAMFGRLRERFAGRSVYNWLCDVEWAGPPGRARAFGGNVLLRRSAVAAGGGYRTDMIAGEDPELSIRLRKAGWRIACIDADMALHDAALTRFGQWWRRTARAGHAFAELAFLHPGGDDGYRRSCRRIVVWGALLPSAAIAGLVAGLAAHSGAGFILFGIATFLPLAQTIRLTIREAAHRPLRQAMILAVFLTIGKYAEITGLVRYHVNRLTRRRSTLIEYKGRGRS